MSGETLLELLTGDVPLIVGEKYTWSGFCEKLYTDVVWTNIPCKLIDLTEKQVIIFDIQDRKRYTFDIEDVVRQRITINP